MASEGRLEDKEEKSSLVSCLQYIFGGKAPWPRKLIPLQEISLQEVNKGPT